MKCSAVAFGILVFLLTGVASQHGFEYGGQHGPDHWGDDYKRCAGKQQSPINIDQVNVVEKSFPPLEFENFDEAPLSFTMVDNGHTVLVKLNHAEGKEARAFGGPLSAKNAEKGYRVEQFHFHWGQNDSVGSEGTINNKRFPAELHLVLRNLNFKDFESALGADHGIAVMAFFFKIVRDENPSYAEFTDELDAIAGEGDQVEFLYPRPLKEYLTFDLINYYTYVGSLTTPPCSESVIWIDFIEPINFSENQLNHFRRLTEKDHHLKNNFRPVQPLNNRTIYSPKLPVIIHKIESAIPFVDAENGVIGKCPAPSLPASLVFALLHKVIVSVACN